MNVLLVVRRLFAAALNIIIGLLTLLFLLRFLGAGAGAPFVQLMTRLADPFLAPFRGMFPASAVGGLTIDWTVLTAMLVYAVVGGIVLTYLLIPSTWEVVERRVVH